MTADVLAVVALLATIPKKVFLLAGFVIAALEALLAIPLIIRKVPPNRFYGFANSESMGSERVWYATNRFFGWCLVIGGLLTAAGTGVLLATKSSFTTKVLAGVELVVVVVLFGAALAATFSYLRRR
jgi:uncharacterized membrane protein